MMVCRNIQMPLGCMKTLAELHTRLNASLVSIYRISNPAATRFARVAA